MMPMTQKVMNVTTAMTPEKKSRKEKRKGVTEEIQSRQAHTLERKKHKQIKYTNKNLLFTQR